jgi:hypothetical protein
MIDYEKARGVAYMAVGILLGILIAGTLFICSVQWDRARYRECRAHGFSELYCVKQ